MTERATNSAVPRLSSLTQTSIVGSGLAGAILAVVGVMALIEGEFAMLFGITLITIGLLGLALAGAAYLGKRPAWAVLVALWGVLGFCAFFATPKVVDLPKLEAVTMEMEQKLGRKKAAEKVEDANLEIRLQNLATCTMFALPFALLCAGLAYGGRDYEPRVERNA